MMSTAWGNAAQVIGKTVTTTLKGVEQEVASRTYRASNELRNASLIILRGKRSGRVYRISGTKQTYKASAPGESPANRTGAFRLSWGTRVHVERNGKKFRAVASIESRVKVGANLLGDVLEHGTGRMKPRRYKRKITEKALPNVKSIYAKPYRGSG